VNKPETLKSTVTSDSSNDTVTYNISDSLTRTMTSSVLDAVTQLGRDLRSMEERQEMRLKQQIGLLETRLLEEIRKSRSGTSADTPVQKHQNHNDEFRESDASATEGKIFQFAPYGSDSGRDKDLRDPISNSVRCRTPSPRRTKNPLGAEGPRFHSDRTMIKPKAALVNARSPVEPPGAKRGKFVQSLSPVAEEIGGAKRVQRRAGSTPGRISSLRVTKVTRRRFGFQKSGFKRLTHSMQSSLKLMSINAVPDMENWSSESDSSGDSDSSADVFSPGATTFLGTTSGKVLSRRHTDSILHAPGLSSSSGGDDRMNALQVGGGIVNHGNSSSAEKAEDQIVVRKDKTEASTGIVLKRGECDSGMTVANKLQQSPAVDDFGILASAVGANGGSNNSPCINDTIVTAISSGGCIDHGDSGDTAEHDNADSGNTGTVERMSNVKEPDASSDEIFEGDEAAKSILQTLFQDCSNIRSNCEEASALRNSSSYEDSVAGALKGVSELHARGYVHGNISQGTLTGTLDIASK
jgi:hypothetical protein